MMWMLDPEKRTIKALLTSRTHIGIYTYDAIETMGSESSSEE